MATLTSTVLTLLDWAKRTDPDGKVQDIAEVLSQQNAILEDMMFKSFKFLLSLINVLN